MSQPLKPAASLVPQGTTAWILTDGKIGDEVHCFGIAETLGLEPVRKLIHRSIFSPLAPWGPIDPRHRTAKVNGLLAPPFPDIAIASGRRTVPYLRYVREKSEGKTFTIFLKDPRTGPETADFIWAPEHDKVRGENVLVTLTSPHRLTPERLAAARAVQDKRIAHLPTPRVGLVIGGMSRHHSLQEQDVARICAVALAAIENGQGVMVTPSRRTPKSAVKAIAANLQAADPEGAFSFVWTGEGENPYLAIMANADYILVTADSVNMIGEAATTTASLYVYEPSGGYKKINYYLRRLTDEGLIRRLEGNVMEPYARRSVDTTQEIADAIAKRYAAWKSGK
ncbi:mitochondrial fission ELM1 family protein [Methylovirgula sp. 4M-Z18]|uniref:mitochondrial fission ELM1 family protein n=1 Tax=Methylovirgula sp. 4M-Z18 TaxID=2293567 RepID=UPI0030CF50A4